MLLTRAPLYSPSEEDFRVRLACVKRAANVRSEPGSNSPIKIEDISNLKTPGKRSPLIHSNRIDSRPISSLQAYAIQLSETETLNVSGPLRPRLVQAGGESASPRLGRQRFSSLFFRPRHRRCGCRYQSVGQRRLAKREGRYRGARRSRQQQKVQASNFFSRRPETAVLGPSRTPGCPGGRRRASSAGSGAAGAPERWPEDRWRPARTRRSRPGSRRPWTARSPPWPPPNAAR